MAPIPNAILKAKRISGFGLSGTYTESKTFDPTSATLDELRQVVATILASQVASEQTIGLIPTITTQPTAVSLTAGNTATFTVAATALPVATYQWQLDSGGGFANISGATSASYTTAALSTLNDGDEYRCNITNSLGTTTSNAVAVSVVETNLRLLSTSRFVGDASVALPNTSKFYFQSAADGQAFPVGTDDFFIMFRMYASVKDTSNNALTDNSVYPFGLGPDANNHLTINYKPSGGTPASTINAIWKLSSTNLVSITFDWQGDAGNVSGTAPIFLKKEGDTITCGTVVTDEVTGYKLVKGSQTSGTALNLDAIMSTTGRLTYNNRYPGATPDGCALSTFVMASLGTGVSFADIEFDTDAQIIQALLDPDRLGAFSASLANVTSFDLCDSLGARKLLNQRTAITTTDKLVCLHTGLELTAVQGVSPTNDPLGCSPYESASFGATMRGNPICRPLAQKIGDVVVGLLPGGQIANNQDARLTVWDAATGYRCKPDIPLIPMAAYKDASNADAITDIYGWAGQNNLGDNHTQMSCVHDSLNDRLLAVVNFHSEVNSNVPDTSDVYYTTGYVATYDNSGVTQDIIPFEGSSNASLNATTYSATHDHSDGYVYVAIRAGGTEDGQQRLVRIAPDGTIATQNYTRTASANPPNCEAAIPDAICPVGDYLVLVHGTRIDGSLDYVGVSCIVMDPDYFDSSVTGWFKGATGENYAPTKALLITADPDIYPIPGPGKTALQAYVDSATAIDPTNWAYGEAPQAAFSDGNYLGIVTRRGNDPDRSDAYLHFEQWMLHVLTLSGQTLSVATSYDITSAMATVAPDFNVGVAGGATVYDYQFNRLQCVVKDTGELQIYVLRRDSNDIQTESSIGTNAINVGTSLGKIVFSDWKNPTTPTTTVGPLFAGSTYDGLTIMPFAVQNGGLIIQAMPSGATVGVANAPECSSVFEAT